jgi:hypothetical protein
LGVANRESGAPLEVAGEGGAEFRAVGQADLVAGVRHQVDPLSTLRLADGLADVRGDHVPVAGVFVWRQWLRRSS